MKLSYLPSNFGSFKFVLLSDFIWDIFCTTPWIIPFENVVHCNFRSFQHTWNLSICSGVVTLSSSRHVPMHKFDMFFFNQCSTFWLDKTETPLNALHTTNRGLYPAIYSVISILLTMPVSSATSERSFSAMKRMKSYLRSTNGRISPDFLNNKKRKEKENNKEIWERETESQLQPV